MFAPSTFPWKDTSSLQSAHLSSILISHIKKLVSLQQFVLSINNSA